MMNCRLPTPNSRFGPSHHRRGGFSFTEILFAVMILGIGFIMVAAMFPVALQQTDNSMQETVAAQVARSGIAYMTQLGQSTFISKSDSSVPGNNLLLFRPT